MKVKNILRFIATGSISLLLAACYGVQMELENQINRRGKIKVVKADGSPIEDLKVTYNETYTSRTNEDGESTYDLQTGLYEDLTVLIEDTDGTLNGSYRDKEVTVDEDDTTTDTVILEEQ